MSFLSPLSRRRPFVRPSVRPRPSLFLQPRLKLFDHQLILPARAAPAPSPAAEASLSLQGRGEVEGGLEIETADWSTLSTSDENRGIIVVEGAESLADRTWSKRARACHLKHVV